MDSEADASGRFLVVLRGEFDSEFDTEMLEADPVNLGDAPRCAKCLRFVGARPWLPPHRVELTLHGTSWGDFAFRGAVGEDFLISATAADLYKASGMTGLMGLEPVEVVRFRGTKVRPPDYLHVAVELSEAAIDESESVFTRSEEVACDQCRYAGTLEAIHGFRVASDTWDGADVFIARGLPGTVIASRRFQEWAQAQRLTNIGFIATEAFEWDSMAPVFSSP